MDAQPLSDLLCKEKEPSRVEVRWLAPSATGLIFSRFFDDRTQKVFSSESWPSRVEGYTLGKSPNKISYRDSLLKMSV